MEQDFYKDKLVKKHNLEVVIPQKEDREAINEIIYKELVKGIIKYSSKEKYLRIMDKMKTEAVQEIIPGCTKIGLLVKHHSLPLFDSTVIHTEQTVAIMLQLKMRARHQASTSCCKFLYCLDPAAAEKEDNGL